MDVLEEVYVPWTSDKIKFNEHFSSAAINNDHAGFFKLWLSMLKKYPESYVKGFLGVTDGSGMCVEPSARRRRKPSMNMNTKNCRANLWISLKK